MFQGVNADGFSLVIHQYDQSSLCTSRVVKDRWYLQAVSENRSDLTDSQTDLSLNSVLMQFFLLFFMNHRLNAYMIVSVPTTYISQHMNF